MSNKSFFKRFAEKWLIQYNHPPYYSKVNQYRYPAPGDTHVNDGVKPAKGAPEFEFQTAMYKRNSIKTTPFPGETANEEPSILPEGNPWVSPSHMPTPVWQTNPTALANMEALYNKTGQITFGARPVYKEGDIWVVPHAKDSKYDNFSLE